MAGSAYYTLIGSLPALPRNFEQAEREPISWLQLEQRLGMLEPRDADTLEQLTRFLAWDRQPLDRSDADVCRRYDELRESVWNPTAWAVVEYRLELRTIISALRRRRRQLGPPPGVGPIALQIARGWNQADFQLGRRFSWIADAERLLDAGRPLELERLLLQLTWQRWTRWSDEQMFRFDAVILYVARWAVLSRWVSRDAAAGRERFASLVTEALGTHAEFDQ